MNEILEIALKYKHKFGWHVIPCRKEKKFSYCSWPESIPSDEQIIEWWTKWPEANIGILTGKRSGVIIWDCDSIEANEWMEEKGLLETLTAQSSKDYKKHYYFKYPDMGFKIGSNCSTFFKKLDIRADGGLIIIPPSIHPSGVKYKWVTSINTPIADMDIWQLELFNREYNKKEKKYNSKFISKHAPNPPFIEEIISGTIIGKRNESAFTLAKHYAMRGYTEGEIYQILLIWNKLNMPPLNNKEIKICARQGLIKSR